MLFKKKKQKTDKKNPQIYTAEFVSLNQSASGSTEPYCRVGVFSAVHFV